MNQGKELFSSLRVAAAHRGEQLGGGLLHVLRQRRALTCAIGRPRHRGTLIIGARRQRARPRAPRAHRRAGRRRTGRPTAARVVVSAGHNSDGRLAMASGVHAAVPRGAASFISAFIAAEFLPDPLSTLVSATPNRAKSGRAALTTRGIQPTRCPRRWSALHVNGRFGFTRQTLRSSGSIVVVKRMPHTPGRPVSSYASQSAAAGSVRPRCCRSTMAR